MVWGLRIGFEQANPVQPKQQDAPIPSMAKQRERIASEPELAAYTALERFLTMTAQLEGVAPERIDLSRSADLVARIHEFNPETDVVPLPPGLEPAETAPERAPRTDTSVDAQDKTGEVTSAPDAFAYTTSAGGPPGVGEGIPELRGSNGTWLRVRGEVSAGDLLTPDEEHPGVFRRAEDLGDPRVLGVATELTRPELGGAIEVWVAMAGVAEIQADAGLGEIRPGDLLVASPTPGHAMRAPEVVPGTIVGKAIDGLDIGTGKIKVLVMLR